MYLGARLVIGITLVNLTDRVLDESTLVVYVRSRAIGCLEKITLEMKTFLLLFLFQQYNKIQYVFSLSIHMSDRIINTED